MTLKQQHRVAEDMTRKWNQRAEAAGSFNMVSAYRHGRLFRRMTATQAYRNARRLHSRGTMEDSITRGIRAYFDLLMRRADLRRICG